MRRPNSCRALIGWFYPMEKQRVELSDRRHTLTAIKRTELRHVLEEGWRCVWGLSQWRVSPVVCSTTLWEWVKNFSGWVILIFLLYPQTQTETQAQTPSQLMSLTRYSFTKMNLKYFYASLCPYVDLFVATTTKSALTNTWLSVQQSLSHYDQYDDFMWLLTLSRLSTSARKPEIMGTSMTAMLDEPEWSHLSRGSGWR